MTKTCSKCGIKGHTAPTCIKNKIGNDKLLKSQLAEIFSMKKYTMWNGVKFKDTSIKNILIDRVYLLDTYRKEKNKEYFSYQSKKQKVTWISLKSKKDRIFLIGPRISNRKV